MKKQLLLGLVILAFAVTATAQENPIDKGSWFLGGHVFFISQGGDLYKVGDESPTTFSLAPEFGYFISPGLFIGAMVDYTQFKIGERKNTDIGVGPIVGYYFNLDKARTDVKGSIYPYIKAFFNYMSIKEEDGVDEEKWTGTQIGGMAGINFLLSEAVALDLGVMFSADNAKPEVNGVEGESSSGTSMQIGAGVTYFIWK